MVHVLLDEYIKFPQGTDCFVILGFCLYRSVEWWNNVVLQTFTFTDADWLENFRMGKSTFYYLCEKLRPFIERKNTRMRLAICVEHRIAITILVPGNLL